MQTKLTLSLEQKIIEQAKAYAKRQGTSLSKMVQEFLAEKTKPKDEDLDIPEEFKGIFGAVKLPDEFDYKKEKAEHLRKKYG